MSEERGLRPQAPGHRIPTLCSLCPLGLLASLPAASQGCGSHRKAGNPTGRHEAHTGAERGTELLERQSPRNKIQKAKLPTPVKPPGGPDLSFPGLPGWSPFGFSSSIHRHSEPTLLETTGVRSFHPRTSWFPLSLLELFLPKAPGHPNLRSSSLAGAR